MQELPRDTPTPLPKVSIVVLNWNNADDTLECLESLLALEYAGPLHILVCDNNSDDDSRERLCDWCEAQPGLQVPETPAPDIEVSVLANPRNLGYAAGNNAAMRFTLERHAPEFIWVLNNDTVAQADSLRRLVECALGDNSTGLLGSLVLDYASPDKVQAFGGGRYLPLPSISWHVGAGASVDAMDLAADGPMIDYVYGASMFMRSSMLREIGLFNEIFFLYYEELDLARRLAGSHYRMGVCATSRVLHKQGASLSSGGKKRTQLATYHENLSTLMYTRLYYPYLLPFVFIFRYAAKILLHTWRGETILLPTINRAFADFFRVPVRPGTQGRSRDKMRGAHARLICASRWRKH